MLCVSSSLLLDFHNAHRSSPAKWKTYNETSGKPGRSFQTKRKARSYVAKQNLYGGGCFIVIPPKKFKSNTGDTKYEVSVSVASPSPPITLDKILTPSGSGNVENDNINWKTYNKNKTQSYVDKQNLYDDEYFIVSPPKKSNSDDKKYEVAVSVTSPSPPSTLNKSLTSSGSGTIENDNTKWKTYNESFGLTGPSFQTERKARSYVKEQNLYDGGFFVVIPPEKPYPDDTKFVLAVSVTSPSPPSVRELSRPNAVVGEGECVCE